MNVMFLTNVQQIDDYKNKGNNSLHFLNNKNVFLFFDKFFFSSFLGFQFVFF